MRKALLLAVLMFVSVASFGQESSKSPLGKFSLEFNTLASTESHDVRELGANVNVSYEFVPRFHVLAQYEQGIGIYDDDETKTNFSSKTLGGGLGYTLCKVGDGGKVDLRCLVSQSIGGNDWKRTVYDANLSWKIVKGISPTLRLGFRHENSHTCSIKDTNVLYGSIGIKF